VVAAPTTFLVPTTSVPMTPEVGALGGHDDEVAHADLDIVVAPRTHISLARLIGLDRADDFVVETSQSRIGGSRRGIEHDFEVRSVSADSCVCARRRRYPDRR
jgi:hypothetical protein